LIARTLLKANDCVLVDDPGYFVLHARLRAHGAHLVPVQRVAEGADLDALESAARLHRPRMFVTQTVLHNPTGTSASAANCHGILTLADKYNFIVVEDHVYTDLAPRRVISLAQIDELKRVLYVGSFTKVLGPGMRIGFIAAPANALRRAGMTIEPSAANGIFLWCRLPAGVDSERLCVDARTVGILLAKGAMFSISGRCSDYLRINAAYGSESTLTQFLASHCEAAA
jgi:DNA-binding transcriptional MocR family regulator